MIDRIEAWQCVGCGTIEASHTCIGVCTDRRVELVPAEDYDAARRDAVIARQRARALEALVRRLAATTPHDGGWERSYRALQAQARRLMAMQPGVPAATRGPDPGQRPAEAA